MAAHRQITELAADAADAWHPDLTARIAATPYLTFFPPSLDSGPGSDPPRTYRFRTPAAVPEPVPDH